MKNKFFLLHHSLIMHKIYFTVRRKGSFRDDAVFGEVPQISPAPSFSLLQFMVIIIVDT